MSRKRSTFAALPFTAFVRDVLRIELTPGQRALYAVAFDGLDPCQLVGADRELARQLFGDVETIPPSARSVLAQRKGARVGGSRFAALRLLHLGLTLPMHPAPGETVFGLEVAPDLRLARQTGSYVKGAVHSTPELARLVLAETADAITLRRPDGIVIELACLPATQRGSAVRGRSLFGAVLSEASFFFDENYAKNDREVFRAIVARIIAGGQLILESTPHSETDLLHELIDQNFGHPTAAIAAHSPTLLMRDDAHTRALVERERERDPDNASREFDAIPIAAGASAFFDPSAIKAAVDDDAPLVLEPAGGCMGLDTAFRKDPSAAVVTRVERGIYRVAEIAEIRPPQGGRLIPSETLARLLERAKHHRCKLVCADQHYIELTREAMRALPGMQLREAPGGVAGKVESYTRARNLLHESKVAISGGHKKLIAQLRDVVSKPTPGGGISITSPRRANSHGDVCSAWVLSVWAAERAERSVSIDFDMLREELRDARRRGGWSRY